MELKIKIKNYEKKMSYPSLHADYIYSTLNIFPCIDTILIVAFAIRATKIDVGEYRSPEICSF